MAADALPDLTPPAHIATLEERIYIQNRDLRSLVHANHMAVLHQLGQLAAGHARIEEQLSRLMEHYKKGAS